MDAELYIAVCFAAFILMSYRYIYNMIDTTLTTSQNTIHKSIEEAESIYNSAKEKYYETKNLIAQLEMAKKYIYHKEEREIEYDLEARKREFSEIIKIKHQQLENIVQRKMRKLKIRSLNKLNSTMQSSFVVYINKDVSLAERFTNTMLLNKS